MARVPAEFREEFAAKGNTFVSIAELLYTHPDHQYTQDELAEEMDCSNTTISNHIRDMKEAGWIDSYENQTTYAWNTNAHDPARTEGMAAVKWFYIDLWDLLKKHSNTFPGAFAIMGFALILAALVMAVFFIGFSAGIAQESSLPPAVYLGIAIGSFLSGVVATLLSPAQAMVNRLVWYIIPSFLQKKE